MLIIETMRYHLAPEKRSTISSTRTKPREATLGSLYCLGGMDSVKGEQPSNSKIFKANIVHCCLGPQTIERYDFRTRSWQLDGHLNTRRWQFACVILDNKLYVCGGRDGLKTFVSSLLILVLTCHKQSLFLSRLNSTEIFDFQKKTWSIGPPMLTNRHGLGVACLAGPLYAIGGHDGWSFLKTVERFDSETCIWSYVASMSYARCTLGVAALDHRCVCVCARRSSMYMFTCTLSRIYVVGGRDGAAGLREAESYDPHTNRWSMCASMQKRRGGVAVAACNGFLFAIGGHESSTTNKCAVRHDDGERYDPRCDQWTFITGFNRPKEALAIAAVSNRLYIVGGFDGKVLDEVEQYDPETDKWSKVRVTHVIDLFIETTWT
jgi:kelch-like protein 1/4/5